MPPKKKLSTEEVATLEQWVKMGAPDPRSTTGAVAKKTKGAEHRGREDILELHPAEKNCAARGEGCRVAAREY